METSLKSEEPCANPPPYFLPVQGEGDDKRISPFTPPPPPGAMGGSFINQTATGGASPPRQRFVQHYETELGDSPGLIRCPSCQNQVMSDVTHHSGTFCWTMCLVFILCGLLLGCCLIPFVFKSFKDAHHTCPRCRMVLHIHRKSCCPMSSEPSSLTPRLGSGHPGHA
ncbi:lipopolysaccharide-induced tumor necrosis factor-alpha factor homolog [Oncorhynchus nerka]|uniref:lipopolysaccharide-induced tumor necrosis factor-alpha factor homolog n=1 Tax=Oncorhynchus nerka TaxID=8023 RepID=UPI0031B8A3F4